MKTYKIVEETIKLDANTAKLYYYTYEKSGFELGFGKAGIYSGHSHRLFCDIIFSATPIITYGIDKKPVSGNLIVVPPRTYLGEVIIDNFFFLKFCPTRDSVIFPEKTNEPLNEGHIIVPSAKATITFPWFESRNGEEGEVQLELQHQGLKIIIGKAGFIIHP